VSDTWPKIAVMKKTFLIPLFYLFFTISGIAQNKPARLIVRVDDMGFSHSGNLAIEKTYREGIATSVEIIVPSPWFPEAVKFLQAFPGIDVGIHIALTSEWDNVKYRPLTEAKSLVDEDGYFFPMIWPNKNYPGKSLKENPFQLKDIENEMRAQIELAMKKLPRISHISAHMGCYDINPETKAIAKKLAQEFKIDIDLQAQGVKYAGYDGPKKTGAEKIASFIKMIEKLKPGETYIFVDHPGLDDAELRAIHHIGYEDVAMDRQGVTDLLVDPAVKAAVKKAGVQLISYAQVNTSTR
jgi:predicted glycoside hydrolase/deacetylase ChbG (UPF0249 family)